MEKVTNWRALIAGTQGSGKSTLAKYIASRNYGTFIIDPLNEYALFHRLVPPTRDYAGIRMALQDMDKLNPRVVIVDEANRFFPAGKPLGKEIGDEYDFQRHKNRSWVFVVRKPQSLSNYIVDLVNVLCIFRLSGSGDKAFLKGMSQSLWERVDALQDHQFVFYQIEKELMTVCEVKVDGNESTNNG